MSVVFVVMGVDSLYNLALRSGTHLWETKNDQIFFCSYEWRCIIDGYFL